MFWAGQALDPNAPLYNMAVNIEMCGPLDPDRLERALRDVVVASDALRTVFEEREGELRCRVLEEPAFEIGRVDFLDEDDPRAAADAWAQHRSRLRFDPGALLFDTALLRIGDDRYVWYLNQHHLVTDAWSTSVIFRNVARVYATGELGELPSFQSYRAFEAEQRRAPGRGAVDAHWREKSKSVSTSPNLYGSSFAGDATRTERVTLDLGAGRSMALRELTGEPGVRCFTPHLALFNIFATLVHAWVSRVSGESRVAIGTPAHNRPTLEFKETIGVFIELFPHLAEVGKEETFHSLLEKVQIETADFL
jgi:hypothetical protein